MKLKLMFFGILLSTCLVFAQENTQTFLSLRQTGVEDFLKKYPKFDGRGVIVFVFDTGVDMGIEGLTKTSTGEVKVIDVQDFTGQGDVKYYEADIENKDGKKYFENQANKFSVLGAEKLSLKADDDKYFIGAVKEDFWKNSGSGIKDINGNGKTDDVFYFVTFKVKEGNENYWVVYFDTNCNGDVSDEKPLRNYREKQDSFFIVNGEKLPRLTMGLNIFPELSLVNFHFDDGGHGTHVAGIATGNNIGQVGLQGVAPGAYVISCKLGNNNFSGGATVTESMKKAYLYADKLSKETKTPCIINMSFGIGSEIEGYGDMEKFLDKLVKENPYLYIAVSNGNEGPGISTSGLPAASSSVFSSGAVLTKEVGNDLYGSVIDNDIILYFSSRGGEVSKPDIVSPGACTSTVPNWGENDRFWGTSMASPYTAGVMALLMSALKVEYPDVKVPSLLLYKAIRESATRWNQYTSIDQGAGFINVDKAYDLLKKYIKNGEIEKFETYKISAMCPNMPDGKAPNIYLRNGSFLTGNETLTYVVQRNKFDGKDKFYRVFTLESDSDWLIPVQKKTYIRNEQPTNVVVRFDKNKMKEPGMYNGKIKAYREGSDKYVEFEMMATVVIPEEFTPENNYRKTFSGTVDKAMFKRYFVNVPAGATNMKLKLYSTAGKYLSGRLNLHSPNGQQLDVTQTITAEKDYAQLERNYFNLEPGVYEVVVEGSFLAKNVSTYNLYIEFGGINAVDKPVVCSNKKTIDVVNRFNNTPMFTLDGKILGYEKSYYVTIKGKDYYTAPFELKEGESERTFEIELTKENFNKVTDFAIMIYNKEDIAIEKDGLSYRKGVISVSDGAGAYKLALIPGFTNAEGELTVLVTEKTYFADPIEVNVKAKNRKSVILYPSVTETLTLDYKLPELKLPEGTKLFGEINFLNNSNGLEYQLPINVN